MRFRFPEELDRSRRDSLLEKLTAFGTSFEGHQYRFFSVDVPPGTSYETVCIQLSAWEAEGLLEYETCEPRVDDSFDDAPEDESDPL